MSGGSSKWSWIAAALGGAAALVLACSGGGRGGAPGGKPTGLATAPAAAGSPQAPAPDPVPLPDFAPGFRLERSLPGGSSHAYRLVLTEGEYVQLGVDQLGVDVVLTVYDPAGTLRLRVDSPTGAQGTEEVFLLAERSGPYRLEVEAWEGGEPGGRYTLRAEARRQASGEDRRRAAAAEAFSRGRLLAGEADGEDAAAASFRQAAGLWGELGDEARQALTLDRLGQLHAASRDPARRRLGTEAFERSVELLRRLGDERRQALVLGRLGRLWERLGESEPARRCQKQALELWRRLGDLPEQAARYDALATVDLRQGEIHPAIDLYTRALELWQQLGFRDSEATTRTNLGVVYATLGDLDEASFHYHRALELLAGPQAAEQRAVTLSKLGDVSLWRGDHRAALAQYQEALELRRRQHDVYGEGVTRNSIGLARVEANQPRRALAAFQEAVEIFRRSGEVAAEAVALENLALAYERLGQPAAAERFYGEALERSRSAAHRQAEDRALLGLARAARRAGRLDAAEGLMRRSLAIVESTRARAWRPDLRASYLAVRQDHYGLLIDLLAERARREPGAGHEARAFAVSEQSRARSLLDALAAGIGGRGLTPAERQRLDGLGRRINSRHLDLLDGPGRGGDGDGADGGISGLLESFWQAEATARADPSRTVADPPILSLRQAQQELPDDDTLLLEYYLGEERSFLWAATSSSLRFVPGLPRRAEIEAAARTTYARMLESHLQTGEVAARQSASRLSQMILGPVADLLGHRRLVIVAPGALQYVPFAALPRPGAAADPAGGPPPPLVAEHEIVTLPSVSVLAALRRRLARRRPPAGLLAMVADPVFGPDDERLAGRHPDPAEPAAAGSPPAPRLERLKQARQEAESILALARGRPVYTAFGFDARRELVTGGRLRDYRILHFATHGLFDTEHPELSALVLSRFDPEGRPVDGYLRAYEVFALDLPVDLVVLSACRTALGEEIRGEGLVGLTRGFMQAGATRVLVSLWSVDDRATSQLMERFYDGLLRLGLPPAQALRRAQLSLSRQGLWRAPYYWAGFVLQGEWN
jgi:CHAT domain-containing protein/tetratricopeptide (TPR) repeat protein